MTRDDLQSRCDYWLDRLGMAEWRGNRPLTNIPRVRVRVRSIQKMDGNLGSCEWHAEVCEAEIEIRRGQGEETLIHEILHLLLEGHTTYVPERYSEMHERALNRLARLLSTPKETI